MESSDLMRLEIVSQHLVMRINISLMTTLVKHVAVSVINAKILKHVWTADRLEITFSQLIRPVELNVLLVSESIKILNASNAQITVQNVQHYMPLTVQNNLVNAWNVPLDTLCLEMNVESNVLLELMEILILDGV